MSNFLNRFTRKCINDQLSLLKPEDNNYRLRKLKQRYITKVDTASIKSLMNKTILQIFQLDAQEDNITIINEAMHSEDFRNIINHTFTEKLDIYLLSEEYARDVKSIKIKESLVYVREYEKQAKSFINYYKIKKPNKKTNQSISSI
jgi:L-fucose mutarotase/ribose pyranase (RbsD/FucU family)